MHHAVNVCLLHLSVFIVLLARWLSCTAETCSCVRRCRKLCFWTVSAETGCPFFWHTFYIYDVSAVHSEYGIRRLDVVILTMQCCHPPNPFWRYSPTRARAAWLLRFLDHTQWHAEVDRTPLDGLVTETSVWQHLQETEFHGRGGIRIRNPSKRSAVDPRFRPLGHWDLVMKVLYCRRVRKNCEERLLASSCLPVRPSVRME
jgi:hypothetical protein